MYIYIALQCSEILQTFVWKRHHVCKIFCDYEELQKHCQLINVDVDVAILASFQQITFKLGSFLI